jgi:hypothetical protein
VPVKEVLMKRKIFPFILLLAFLFQPGLHRLNSESGQAQKDQNAFQQSVVVTLKLVQVHVTDKKGNPITSSRRSPILKNTSLLFLRNQLSPGKKL